MKTGAASASPPAYTESSGNVFSDLDLPDADELLAKSELVHQITGVIRRRKLTQKDAAAVLGTTQPIVSDLVRRRLDRFSLERLFAFLNRLDRDVQIIIRPKPRSRSAGPVMVQAQSRALASAPLFTPSPLPAPRELNPGAICGNFSGWLKRT